MEITAKLETISGVGPSIAAKFATLGVNNVADLLDYFPRDYRDYSKISKINQLQPGLVTIQAQVKQAKGRYVRRGMHITEAVASDDSGSVRLLWFNQPYRAASLKPTEKYFITGKLELKRLKFSITNPSVELASDLPVHTARIVPVYRETKGVTAALIRRVMFQVLKAADQLSEPLPDFIRKKYGLMSYGNAVKEQHFPSSRENFASARHSIGFIEVFELMLASRLNKQEADTELSHSVVFKEKLAKQFVKSLPFKLTDAQRRAAWQIFKDIEQTRPMNRLLEGDVGSGKTVVAAMAGLMTMESGRQVALLAPTELLARQHADTLSQLLGAVGRSNTIGLLVGSLKPAQKRIAHERIASNDIKFVIGTHALLQDKVDLKNLGLLVVDEQHRFGVEQRRRLIKQNGFMPHILSMTATPIPRSLALTLYGELDISLLDTMPAGRKPVVTEIVSPNSRTKLNERIEAELIAGRQVYIVCPIITDSSFGPMPSAEKIYKQLKETTFKKWRLGLLHGKMKSVDKERIMGQFVSGQLDMLVATTVIEVGISVANASVMVIEGAERFGLAQIHQLRGRVGRSGAQGYCFIVPSDSKPPSRRLRALTESTNGFELAELDLEIRGPGAIYGTLQHGELDLRIAKLSDVKLLAAARQAVGSFMTSEKKLSSYPELARRVRAAQAVVTLS